MDAVWNEHSSAMSRRCRSLPPRRGQIVLCAIVACSLLAAVCEAYSGLIAPDAANPGKCVYRGDTLKLGENTGIAPCQRLTCFDDGSLLIEGCGKLRIENCNRGERVFMDKPYPDCCKLKYKCKRPDGSSYYIERDMVAADANKAENST